jgi:hypothetical protein
VSRLELAGLDADGFCTVALPQGGIRIEDTAALAMHFSLAESLTVQSEDVWVLHPNVWAVDEGTLSSVDVQFQASSSFSQYLTQGFHVILLDTNLRPVSQASLAAVSSTLYSASFQYVASFQGPFVAVLVPPPGIVLASQMAISIDIQTRVHVQTSVGLRSVQRSGSALDIRTGDRAVSVQRDHQGHIVQQEERPVGWIDDVAPHMRSREPTRAGTQPAMEAPSPNIPGLPPAGENPHRQPQAADGGAPPPRHDAGGPPPPQDGGPRHPAQGEAGGPTPVQDPGAPRQGAPLPGSGRLPLPDGTPPPDGVLPPGGLPPPGGVPSQGGIPLPGVTPEPGGEPPSAPPPPTGGKPSGRHDAGP